MLRFPSMGEDEAAQAAMLKVEALIEERRFRDAVEPAKEACRLNPPSAGAWGNYAIALKHACEWAECMSACERAIELDTESFKGACWNAGIAASALGRWPRARRAWSSYGIEMPEGEGPPELRLGHAAVRVAIDTEPEVVLCQRIDPCRARIESVPLAESDRRFGDVVLHDGERRGSRELAMRKVPMFDELSLLRRSAYETWKVTIECAHAGERDELLALFRGLDGAVEDWSESITFLCAQCSAGVPHDEHPVPANVPWLRVRKLGLAITGEDELKRLKYLGRWRRGVHGARRVL